MEAIRHESRSIEYKELTKEEYFEKYENAVFETFDDADKIEQALKEAFMYSQIDGSHHKEYVIDQMVRILTGKEGYDKFIKEYKGAIDENGCPEYTWSEGIAP